MTRYMDLLSPSILKELCARAGMRPQRSSGQHFLVSRRVLDTIVTAVDPKQSDTILEVGSGFGVLTTALAPYAGRIVAVERDRHVLPLLREIVAPFGNIEVVEEDVLTLLRGDRLMSVIARSRATKQSRGMRIKTGIASVAPLPRNDTGEGWKLATNLPYGITSDFLRMLFDAIADGTLPPPTRAVLLLQREVVDRLCGLPGARGFLTILTELHAQPRRVLRVPASAFWPSPKVESAVVSLEHFLTPQAIAERLGGVTRAQFLALLRTACEHPRRQLRVTLQDAALGGRQRMDTILRAAHIDPTERPAVLTLDQWIVLAQGVHAHRAAP